MIAILVVDDDVFCRQISHRLRLQGYEIIRYRDPVKLSDNIIELAPDLVVINGQDFPLHWQVLSAEIRMLRRTDTTVIVVSSSRPQNFEQFEKLKIVWLEYSGEIDKTIFRACLDKASQFKKITVSTTPSHNIAEN